ncbi:MAG: hypothetical protein E7646_04630 [Ruminococcaceae bacterium]|nr:hypothetical protein [Oscillospiraceae bacterium]
MKKNLLGLLCVLLIAALCFVGCEAKTDGTNEGAGANNGTANNVTADNVTTENGTAETQESSPYKVTFEQWESIIASSFENYTCDASTIDEQIYKLCPAENLYYRQSVNGSSENYYHRKGDKVDHYFVHMSKTTLQADEQWEMHERNATGGFEFSSDWLEWLPGIYNLQEFRYSEEDHAYTFYNSGEFFEFYFENGKLIRMVYGDDKGEREYSDFGTTEITLPEME